MGNVKEILSKFRQLTLDDLQHITLMDRYDVKFWGHKSSIANFITDLLNDFEVLNVEGNLMPIYETLYFDTADWKMYNNHHENVAERFKIRKRSYMQRDEHFLEVKQRYSELRTIKNRISIAKSDIYFDDQQKRFLSDSSNFDPSQLEAVVKNRFNRITLIDRKNQERCTIDSQLSFWFDGKMITLDDLAVFEIKQRVGQTSGAIQSLLQKHGIVHLGLSKYCTAHALLNSEVEHQNFDPRLAFLLNQKMSRQEIV